MLPRSLWLTLFSWLTSFTAVHADGSVEGALVLDQPKPVQTAAGYKPVTKQPIEKPDTFVAIVYLESKTKSYPKVSESVIKIAQKGYQFSPSIMAVQTGAKVLFPNMDEEFHNVFSYSKTKRFDLGRFRREDDSPAISFDKSGIVKIYCEIHQHMRCILLVLDTPWFSRTDARGGFKITKVPAGDYTLKAFLPSERVVEMPVKIRDGNATKVELKR
jgi:plastocyanin